MYLISKLIFIFLCALSTSCSFILPRNDYSVLSKNIKTLDKDYKEHFKSLGKSFENNKQAKIFKLSKRTRRYLKEVHNRIFKNNELLLDTKDEISLKIIKNKAPIIFSLPGQQVYMSSGLIKNYIQNESLFLAALTYEIIKSARGVYRKNTIIPTGTISIYEILSLTSLSLKYKRELNKLTYYALKRARYEQSAVLNWIQIQNKNAVDFAMLNSNRRIVVEEELYFKKFLAAESDKDVQIKSDSTFEFYYLLNEVKRKSR